jgi:hypothetical protein
MKEIVISHHNNFLTEEERREILLYVDSINHKSKAENVHLKHLISEIKGNSHMYDISKTEITHTITNYQSGGSDVMNEELPSVFHSLRERIASYIQIPNTNAFLQIVDMDKGGKIGKHYDASYDGYINFKCNISVISEDYDFCVDSQTITIAQGDLYCFEASLYKHWTPNSFSTRRVLLSFGFMLPYSVLGRNEEDARVRLSQRIQKYFQHS